jgi:hypothetical protein
LAYRRLGDERCVRVRLGAGAAVLTITEVLDAPALSLQVCRARAVRGQSVRR